MSGNNDRFRIDASAFGGGLVAGVALTAARLQSSSASTAGTSDVRFIDDTDDGILRYDADGSAAGAAIVLATLTLTLADFLMV